MLCLPEAVATTSEECIFKLIFENQFMVILSDLRLACNLSSKQRDIFEKQCLQI